jgi:type II secretory pathway predicted ATPase ExeA
MYEAVLQLHSRPFASNHSSEQTCFGQSIQKALANARLCIERANGPALIIGVPGVGKTTLLSVLRRQYEANFHVVIISCSRLDGRLEFLQAVLFELHRPYRGLSEGELRLSLLDFLRTDVQKSDGLLLMIDDGENLSVEVLDEIRVVSNFVQDGQPKTRLIIAGGFRLEELLTDARLQSLNQRIATRCFLRNLTQTETAEYVRDQIQRAGGQCHQLFGDDSLHTIFELTDGCPRSINQLCDHALILCVTHGRHFADQAIIREAWSDLQCFPDVLCDHLQAPHPMCSAEKHPGAQADWSIIEFGSLDDSPSMQAGDPSPPANISACCDTADSNSSWTIPHSDLNPPDNWVATSEIADEPQSSSHSSTDPSADTSDQSNPNWDQSQQWARAAETVNQDSLAEAWNASQEFSYQPLTPVAETQQPATPTPAPPYVALNPFAEQFSEVEVVTSRFASQIAQCNRSSQDLTPNDLNCLIPLDGQPNCNSIQEYPADGGAFEIPTCDSSDLKDRFEVASSDADAFAINGRAWQWERPSSEEELTGQAFYTQETPSIDHSGIERQADEILQQLANAFGEPCETYDRPITVSNENLESAPFAPRLASPTRQHSESFCIPGADRVQANVCELQQLESLKQTIEDQNRFSAQAFDRLVIQTNTQAVGEGWSIRPAQPQSVNPQMNQPQENVIFQTAGQILPHQDDRDMLICQPNPDVPEQQLNLLQNRMPIQPTPVSTGRAARMDYQQLFDQLRNLPNT